ncbi:MULTISPECIES: GNAT family N-acetyltransferase [unclassified Paenibacillus]|uniref:GNAT family N-acetyltransferase n=1 Tax=unclassified Paenibacillus TaxID=185978 RepID=UPI0027889EA0|nr:MULTISPECIES: GNAT family N-acetyltransferase [unclassified Paenibacillus]MDQ0896183.1 putative acetyltransferase [Paenibacillus sp. V4I7]MDQ0914001.1 putative acetyltransferase [Paenibacillus sp. V4I5]
MELLIDKVDSDRKEILRNLMTLFLHDLSEFIEGINLNSDNGLFEFDVLDMFFDKEGLSPFFINLNGKPIGFILLQSGPYSNQEYADYVLNSFFILRNQRRKGIGKLACNKFFEMYPGRYAISQAQTNTPALKFWKSVYESNGVMPYEKEEIEDGISVVYQYFKTH